MWFGSWSDRMPVVRVDAAAYLWLVVRTANLGKTNPGQTQRLRGAGGGALIPAGTEFVGGLGFDQRLQAGADQFGEHAGAVGALECVELSEQCRMVVGHRVAAFCESLWSVTR